VSLTFFCISNKYISRNVCIHCTEVYIYCIYGIYIYIYIYIYTLKARLSSSGIVIHYIA